MYKDRVNLYKELESKRQSKLLIYVTGDRPNLETQISSEVLNFFLDHLDVMDGVSKIFLYLYTRGGETLAAWSIANLIRQFCSNFEVMVPSKALSGGTLICLGADNIVMTKQATLGPIDPSVNTPLNPGVPGGPLEARVPVSVEAINGYIELAKKIIGSESGSDLANIITTLSSHVHPLVLGDVYRTRNQIRMLGGRLLSKHMSDAAKIEKILSFLCSDSGSHDYTIYRQEARDDLGLSVERPDEDLYKIMKQIYDNVSQELKLTEVYNPIIALGAQKTFNYEFTRVLIESVGGGSHKFRSKGQLVKNKTQEKNKPAKEEIVDNRLFEGWEYEHA